MPKEKAKSKLKELQKEIKECENLKSEYLAGWQRAKADFLNYKKEEAERIKEVSKYIIEDLILEILPILDNFYLAESKISEDLKNNEYMKGVLQIKVQIQDFLKNQGIEEIRSLGEEFNPSFHKAVEQIEKSDEKSGKIIEEIQKGYKLHNKVIRPAKVKVTK